MKSKSVIYYLENQDLFYVGGSEKEYKDIDKSELISIAINKISSLGEYSFIPTKAKWLQMLRYGSENKQWNSKFTFRIFNEDLSEFVDHTLNYESKIELNVS